MSDQRWSKSQWDALQTSSLAILKGAASLNSRGAASVSDLQGWDREYEGDNVRDLIVKHFARNGAHCDTARLVFPRGIPRDVQHDCEMARRVHLTKVDD